MDDRATIATARFEWRDHGIEVLPLHAADPPGFGALLGWNVVRHHTLSLTTDLRTYGTWAEADGVRRGILAAVEAGATLDEAIARYVEGGGV